MSKVQRPRLGRGLSSLISMSDLPVQAEVHEAPSSGPTPPPDGKSTAQAARSNAQENEISINQIRPNPHQPRRKMDETRLSELAASLKTNGLIQPIIVRAVADGYELIAGERRLRAAQLAGFSTIPAIVREVDAWTQAQMALVENIQREDLNPLDRAESYRSLMEQLGLTQVELAGRLGEDRSSIANHLRILDLAGRVQEMVRDGQLSLGHAKLLAGVSDTIEQERLANLVISQSLSVRNLERLIQQGSKPAVVAEASKAAGSMAHIVDLERSLSRQLGMRTQIKSGKKGKGKLILHYASLDQFDELLNRMGVKTDE
ncbi:MAG: ParB/RepB/Spo0J family partition protein [Phycisphaerales bacterium]|nr:ParB/RepB/Spo0J family partition protein [Phycisphaerales bacterium]